MFPTFSSIRNTLLLSFIVLEPDSICFRSALDESQTYASSVASPPQDLLGQCMCGILHCVYAIPDRTRNVDFGLLHGANVRIICTEMSSAMNKQFSCNLNAKWNSTRHDCRPSTPLLAPGRSKPCGLGANRNFSMV